ncbi:MAG: helix-turn-helix domain-containing protein [Candidatus Aenigmatarchaeota archaeon]
MYSVEINTKSKAEEDIRNSELLEALKDFGLTEYETKVYTTLIFLGPSKVGKISKVSKVPQSKIYGVLEELAQKELVEVFDGRPKEIRAIPPSLAFKNLLQKKEEDLKILKSKINFLTNALERFGNDENFCEGIWVQKNEKNWEVLNRFSEMLNNCEKYAFDITRDFSLTQPFKESIRRCIRNGIKLMAISTIRFDRESIYRAKWFYDNGLKIKIFETEGHPRVLIVDGKEVAIRLENYSKKSFYFQFISSRNKFLTRIFDNYAKTLWKIAKPLSFRNLN